MRSMNNGNSVNISRIFVEEDGGPFTRLGFYMELLILPEDFSICKLKDYSQIDINQPFVFTGSTDEEKSLVCPTRLVPPGILERSDGWRGLRIAGVLDFSLVGVIAGISDILAKDGIGIFVLSTFDTDYILIRNEQFEVALKVLELSGYIIT